MMAKYFETIQNIRRKHAQYSNKYNIIYAIKIGVINKTGKNQKKIFELT